MLLKSLEIHDMLSIGDIALKFQDSGLFLIDGWNYDDNTANGAGKTSIWNALSFALYGKLPRKVTVSELVRRGAKHGYVKAEIEVNGNHIVVERHRPKKESFTVNGRDIQTQVELEKYLNLNYKQFLMCMYSSQSGQGRFVDLSDVDKKEFFLNLIDLGRFDGIKAVIDEKLNTYLKELDQNSRDIEKCNIKISAYSENLEDKHLLEKELEKIDTESLKKDLNSLNVDRPDTSKIDVFRQKLDEKLNNIRSQAANIALYRSKIEDIDARVLHLKSDITSEHLITCPSCQDSFVLSGNNSLTIQQVKERLKDKITSLKNKKKELILKIESAEDFNSKEEEIQDLIVRLRTKKEEVLNSYLKNKEQYTEIRAKIEIQNSKAEGIKSRISSGLIFEEKIKEIEKVKRDIDRQNKELTENISIYSALSHIYSPVGAQAYILDNVVEMFNQRILEYVSMIWPNASYELRTYKENKSGGIKAKLSDKLTISGKDTSLGSLSGGELKCLCLSIDLAIVDIMELMLGAKISPYILDEPFGGLDASNRERAISILEGVSKNRQICVIDHQSETRACFSDIIRVEKRNGVSSVV